MSDRHTELAVHEAVASVDDPEYPGVSIVDLGLLESIEFDGANARIGLVPTFSGCPALATIADDVERAVVEVKGVASAEVLWLSAPAWDPSRISADARALLGDQFTIAVQIGDRAPLCPRCGSPTSEQSLFGPTRCRSIHRCTNCSETVEVVRG